MRWSEVRPHPTDMQILNDAGVGDYPQADVDAELAGEGIIMTRHPAGSSAAPRGVFVDREVRRTSWSPSRFGLPAHPGAEDSVFQNRAAQ